MFSPPSPDQNNAGVSYQGMTASVSSLFNPAQAVTPVASPATNLTLLAAVRNEAARGPYQIKIWYIHAPKPPANFFGAWKGQCVVFYDLNNKVKQEPHWAFRPSYFGRITDLARQHGCGIPNILFSVLAFPKRSLEDSYKQCVRQFKVKSTGNNWQIHDFVLGFAMPNDKSEEEIKTTVMKQIDALCDKETKELYYEQRKPNASPALLKEIDPTSGPFWTTLRSAKAETVLCEVKHIDMVVTTGTAIDIAKEMFGFEAGDPSEWNNPEVASFASSVFSQISVAR